MGREKESQDRFCILPFSSLVVVGNGRVSTCSSAWDVLAPVEAGSIQAAWQGECLKDIRQAFRENKFHKNCRNCQLKESGGYFSKRQFNNQNYRNRFSVPEAEWENYTQAIMAEPELQITELDLSFSKKCNLTCAMCSSEFSSAWVKQDREFFASHNVSFRDEVRPHVQSLDSHASIVDEVLAIAGGLSQLKIKGGEPLVDPLCLDFLERLANTEFSGQIWLVTNGTRADERTLRALSKAPNLNISLSIDGVDETYEWIRGFSFSELEENIESYLRLPNLQSMGAAFTSSAFNILNVPAFLHWDRRMRSQWPQKYLGAHFLQHVYQPYMRPENISLELRQKIHSEINSLLSEKYSPIGIRNTLNILRKNQFSIEVREQFHTWAKFMENLREKSIFSIFPELAKHTSLELDQSPSNTSPSLLPAEKRP